jgi:catechol 2,3-dioxygenase-like lactoylglutathione lyase family enzyme
VRLLVVDFEACFRFYRDVMGLRVTWGEERDAYASFVSEGGASLSLFKREVQAKALGTSNLPESAVAQDRMALIFTVNDLDTTVKRLKERNVVFITEPREHSEWGIRVVYLRDPDGNLIEINSPMPTSDWTKELQEEKEKYGTKK